MVHTAQKQSFLLVVGVAAAWVAAGCAVPFGPAYSIEKQRIEAIYLRSAPDRVNVRAWYRMKNTGTKPIGAMRLRIPFHSFVENLHAEWNGAEIRSSDEVTKSEDFSMRLGAPWQGHSRAEFSITYDLHIIDPKLANSIDAQDSRAKDHYPAFSLSAPGWYPALLPPEGALAEGGEPPDKWDLVVTVPTDFQVHASGVERGRDRSSGANGGSVSLEFGERQGTDFNPFVVAGPYQERQIVVGSVKVFLWLAHAIPEARVRELSEHYAAVTTYYSAEFGSKDENDRRAWIVDCPADPATHVFPSWGLPVQRLGALLTDGSVCFAQPQTAFDPDMVDDQDTGFVVSPKGAGPRLGQESVEVQLAATWFYFGLGEDPKGPSFPISGAPEYAALSFANFSRPSARSSRIGNLINKVDIISHGTKNALTSIDDSAHGITSPGELNAARIRSELFFLALEDRCGAANVHHALARVVRILRGETWGVNDLRSAMEAECGADLADFFRQWLNRPGIPDEFRARYAGTPAAKQANGSN